MFSQKQPAAQTKPGEPQNPADKPEKKIGFRWSYIVLPLVILLISIVITIYFYGKLPDAVVWRFNSNDSPTINRWQNQDELNKLIAGWTKDFTHYEVMHKLQKVGIAAGASLNTGELFNDPHVKERGAFIELNHPEAGKTVVWRSPWKSALTATNPPAPCLGEHNNYVFKELLGMTDKEVAELIDDKVIY